MSPVALEDAKADNSFFFCEYCRFRMLSGSWMGVDWILFLMKCCLPSYLTFCLSIIGARVNVFMLESSRVTMLNKNDGGRGTHVSQDDQNFHIFDSMLKGLKKMSRMQARKCFQEFHL